MPIPKEEAAAAPECQTQEQQQRLVSGAAAWQADAAGVLHASCALVRNATRQMHLLLHAALCRVTS
jgi:hypothetical protein